MYVGFTLSLLAHLTLLGWALINFQATPPLKIGEREAVEVALISPDDLVRLTKGDRTSKNLKTRQSKQLEKAPVKKTAKKAVIKTTPPPAASEPPVPKTPDKPDDISKKLSSLAEPPQPAGPTPEELATKKAAAEKFIEERLAEEAALQKAVEEKKEKADAEKKRKAAEAKRKKAEALKKKRATAKRARERKRKLAEKKRRERERQAKKFDPGKLSALLNKIPDSKAPDAGSQDPNNDRRLPKGPQAGARDGNDTRLTASQQSFMRSRIQGALRPCWILPGGGGGTNTIPVVTLRWSLRRDGSLDGNPKVVNGRSGAIFAAAAAAAQRAIIQCQPIRLPPELYANWKTIEWEFDPREMQ